MWVAIEAAGGRKRGDIVAVEPNPLPINHVRLGSRAIVPDLLGGGEGCLVKRVLQQEAVNFQLEDIRILPVQFDQQGQRRREFSAAVPIMVDGSPMGGGLQLDGPATALNIAKSLRGTRT